MMMETSIIIEEVKVFNKNLNDVTNKYRHTSVIHMDLARENFTCHGLHLRNSGKDKLVMLLKEKIEMQLQKIQTEMLISLVWGEDASINSTDVQGRDSAVMQNIPSKRRWKMPTTRSEDFLWG
jgi:hypothetical protein